MQDVDARPPLLEDIDDTIPNYFNVHPDPPGSTYETYRGNHIFETSGFKPLVKGFQQAISRGTGCVVQTALRTVENPMLGITGTFKRGNSYLSKCDRG